VLGFVKTLIKIHKDPLVLEYGMDARLQAKMGEFSVSMGFGLHIGWAIEGAIGSEYKIDASYLSPNVNMASRLEAATKQFGVDFLISEDLYDVLTA
jgi:class 3 adenylate cyclase